jgi:hypothetical protein
MTMPDVRPGGADAPEPVVARARPGDLFVDETYQRNLSERSVALIRKMVSAWNWSAYQLPLVVRVDGVLHVIDGQHTAIAAASHPSIDTIPVLVVEGADVAARAGAFLGRNRDRIIVTPNQLHYAAVVAGTDEDAVTVDQVCRRAGVRILKFPPGRAWFKPGDTLAIGAVYALVRRRGAMGARKVLEACAKARLAPVPASFIKAVEDVLLEQRRGDLEDVATLIRAPGIELAAKKEAAASEVPVWRALTAIIVRRLARGRAGAA